jgi:UDP-2-acetamido-2-deoxy-ribo-hexuluronate aminotransferase
MITLSGFGYEEKLKVPSKVFSKTFKNNAFINGPAVKEFEEKFRQYVNAEDCVAVSSCTSALQLSLLALSVGPGDEVITVPYTWVSTVEAIRQVGAKPVFVDINEHDLCMDVTKVSKVITSKTKAIIPVDLYGNVADIDYLKRFNLPIVQDSAQSTGAIYKGKRVGGISHLTCFSFYPTKNLGCWGDAGAVTGDVRYCDTIRQLRNHGQTSKFDIKQVGWNSRMDSIQAEVLLNKLPLLDKHNKRRREIAFMYNEALQDIVTIPYQNKNSSHIFHQYVIQSIHREKIQEALHNKKIQSRAYYPIPLNEILPYRTEQKFVNSQHASLTGLAIPVHQYLTTKEIKLIIETIKKVL